MSDPLQSGLSAGQDAYNGAAPKKRLGISAADLSGLQQTVSSGLNNAAAQRNTIGTNAAKQAAGYYPTSGTSAAMYNYMRGQGGYPVNAVPSNQPVNTGTTGYGGINPATSGTQLLPSRVTPTTTITRPPIGVYEDPTKVPKTQTQITNDAKTTDTKMGKVTQPTINMPKPGLVNQLLATAAPMYLGYTLLDKSGLIGGIGNAYNNFMYPTGVYGADGTLLAPDAASYFPPPTSAPAAASTMETALYENNPYMDAGPAVTVAENVTPGVVSDAGAVDAGLAAAADAGVYDAAGNQIAPDVGSYFGAGAGATTGGAGLTDLAGNAGYDTTAMTAGDAGAAAMSESEAAALAEANGMDWAAMTAEYGPYVAAAIIADQLTGGKISNAVGDVVQGIGGAAEDVVSGIGEAGQDLIDTVTGGGCYITTAATKHGGQADDGEVLNTLRHFRDTYMRKDAEKNKDVAWYYKNAPKIVNAIDKMPEADAVYQKLYKQYILPAYHAIKKGENARAFKLYKNLVKHAEDVAGLHRGKELTARYNVGGLTALAYGGSIPVGSPSPFRQTVGVDDGPSSFAANDAQSLMYQNNPTVSMARGGISHLGDFSDGGRLLRGPGDGVSDSIPATIGGKQPARLADGEFVVPARIVSELGNGSTEAGARKLYEMMDRVQKARGKTVGKGKVAKNTRADKHLPA